MSISAFKDINENKFVVVATENSLEIGTFFNIKILLENKQFRWNNNEYALFHFVGEKNMLKYLTVFLKNIPKQV